MNRFRFVHAADLHLDSPFRGLSRTSPEAARVLVEATFRAFENIVELCVRESVDALVIAGDVHDRGEPSIRADWRFRDALRRLTERGVSCFVVRGNHDPLVSTLPGREMSAGHEFGADPSSAPLVRDGVELARIFGVSHDRPEVRENLASRLRRTADTPFAIGLVHANLGGRAEDEPYAPCSVEDLLAGGMDYWALGHVHTREIVRTEAPLIVYPGNPQGLNPRETGPRGCYLVTVENGFARVEFVATDVVRWETVTVSADGVDDPTDLTRRIESALTSAFDAAHAPSLIARLRLTGRSPFHREIGAPGALRPLLDDLEAKLSGRGRLLLIDAPPVEIRPIVDRAALLAVPSLSGAVLRIAEEIRSGRADAGECRAALADLDRRLAEVGLAAPPAMDELLDRVDRAAELAVELLDEEAP